MSLLCWDKPERVIPVEEWKSISADSAPPGVFTSNMSKTDFLKWKAKLVGHRAGHPQVEIRRAGVVIIVSLGGGYRYKFYKPEKTAGVNLHIASSDAIRVKWEWLTELVQAVAEAREALEALEREIDDGQPAARRSPRRREKAE